MKKVLILGISSMLFLTSCGTPEENMQSGENIALTEEMSIAETPFETGAFSEGMSEAVEEATEYEDIPTFETTTLEGSETEIPVLEESVYEYPEEDSGSILNESRLEYSMVFFPTVFTLDDTQGDMDNYIYNTSEDLAEPIYIAIQSYPDMDAQTLIDGIVLQTGRDDIALDETAFGADGIICQYVNISEENSEGIVTVTTYYAVPVISGALLVEISGYVGMPEQAEFMFEEMLGTFTISS